MNDILYRDLIVPWIPHHERAILNKKDYWLIPIKRIVHDTPFCGLLVDILLHGGTPCLPRFCICRYFFMQDKAYFCRGEFPFYPGRVDTPSSDYEEEQEE